jgi:hypothetical protein
VSGARRSSPFGRARACGINHVIRDAGRLIPAAVFRAVYRATQVPPLAPLRQPIARRPPIYAHGVAWDAAA